MKYTDENGNNIVCEKDDNGKLLLEIADNTAVIEEPDVNEFLRRLVAKFGYTLSSRFQD